jgi:hypothetical protein
VETGKVERAKEGETNVPRSTSAHFDTARRFGLLSRAVFVKFELIEDAIPSVVEVEDRHVEHEQWIAHSAAAPEHFWQFVREMSFHSCLFLLRELPTIFYSRVHSFCFLLTFPSLNSMIIKFLVCSPAFATLQLLFAGTQAHRAGTAVSQSLSSN